MTPVYRTLALSAVEGYHSYLWIKIKTTASISSIVSIYAEDRGGGRRECQNNVCFCLPPPLLVVPSSLIKSRTLTTMIQLSILYKANM